jgi:hypothetical protein
MTVEKIMDTVNNLIEVIDLTRSERAYVLVIFYFFISEPSRFFPPSLTSSSS